MAAVHDPGAGPWRPSAAARPLRWWDERRLGLLAKALQDLLSQWRAAWEMSCGETAVECQAARRKSLVAGCWLALRDGTSPRAWWLGASDDNDGLLQTLFPGAVRCGPLAHAMAESCRRDAVQRIADWLGLACGEADGGLPDAGLGCHGSGAVEAALPFPLAARLVLSAEVAARCMTGPGNRPSRPKLEPLVPATTALARSPLGLSVELQGCEIDVGALQALQVGDVVCLEHQLHAPATVRHAGASLCSAYIGRRGGCKAVELAGCLQPAAGEPAP